MKIAVWYHCKLAGDGIPDSNSALIIFQEQMRALRSSGLEDAADEIHIGVNGHYVWEMTGSIPDKATVYWHGAHSRTELPTLWRLGQWLKTCHPSAVLYHHSKGVTHPQDAFHNHHRRVMQQAVVNQWRRCVDDLERGYDAVGVNWVDPITRPVLPGRFFAGNFWWATSAFLRSLGQLPHDVRDYNHDRMLAEIWIGSSKKRPKVMDYERPKLYPL